MNSVGGSVAAQLLERADDGVGVAQRRDGAFAGALGRRDTDAPQRLIGGEHAAAGNLIPVVVFGVDPEDRHGA